MELSNFHRRHLMDRAKPPPHRMERIWSLSLDLDCFGTVGHRGNYLSCSDIFPPFESLVRLSVCGTPWLGVLVYSGFTYAYGLLIVECFLAFKFHLICGSGKAVVREAATNIG